MTNIEKLMELIEIHFGFKAKYPLEFASSLVDCEECPARNQCDVVNLCCVDEWWNQQYNEGVEKK